MSADALDEEDLADLSVIEPELDDLEDDEPEAEWTQAGGGLAHAVGGVDWYEPAETLQSWAEVAGYDVHRRQYVADEDEGRRSRISPAQVEDRPARAGAGDVPDRGEHPQRRDQVG